MQSETAGCEALAASPDDGCLVLFELVPDSQPKGAGRNEQGVRAVSECSLRPGTSRQ